MNKSYFTFRLYCQTILTGALLMCALPADSAELTAGDFSFQQPLGSQGTVIEKIDTNHFLVKLGHAPNHPDWCNKLQFKILRHAKGNTLRLDVIFEGGDRYILNEYYHSWSYDAKNWTPIQWQKHSKDSLKGDTFLFPTFTQDVVYVGHQTPMSYEDSCALIDDWKNNPCVRVYDIGESLGGRTIQRLTIADSQSPHPEEQRWVHYFANQHPGEHNSQWRMAGMIDWLLSEEAQEYRKNHICHFILMMSPDGPSNGWYRVNAQGVDMNRSYRAEGASPEQAHEACLCQDDLEMLMASNAPVTDLWSMHTWGGIVEPICIPGPEMGTIVGPWTKLKDCIEKFNSRNLVKPLAVNSSSDGNPTYWTSGPHKQFELTAVLCEGGGGLYTKQDHLESGEVLIQGIMSYYRGVKSKK